MECNLSRFLLYMAHNQQRSLNPRHHPRVLLSHAHINHRLINRFTELPAEEEAEMEQLVVN